ncbi:MAG TPA: hypothetical protein VN040_14920 [Pseudosphingobacterium sp.]|nr:hypothetical protein [Pseudosphingobacterium sp.]
MSEFTRIVVYMALALIVIYGLLIKFSLLEGKSVGIYICAIVANVIVGLWFWSVATQPDNDPQAGMGLGPIMIICGIITIALPLIAIVIYLLRRFIN